MAMALALFRLGLKISLCLLFVDLGVIVEGTSCNICTVQAFTLSNHFIHITKGFFPLACARYKGMSICNTFERTIQDRCVHTGCESTLSSLLIYHCDKMLTVTQVKANSKQP